MPMDEITRRFLVMGKVQGVFFRQSTRLEANRLKLKGLARNLPDGSVEIVARGAAAEVEALHQWLRRGPTQARVEEVRETDATDFKHPIPEGFAVL
jgi:acylphosphatase